MTFIAMKLRLIRRKWGNETEQLSNKSFPAANRFFIKEFVYNSDIVKNSAKNNIF